MGTAASNVQQVVVEFYRVFPKDSTDPPSGHVPTRVNSPSDAALAVLHHLGGGWRVLAALGREVPRVVRDAFYDAVARRRFTLAARACLLPRPEERARFLD